MLPAGKLRQRVTLERHTVGKDPRGQDVESWDDYATVWAQVQKLSGDEAVTAMQVNPSASWQVNIRFRNDVKPDDRIAYDDGITTHTLNVITVEDRYQRREELVLTCGESGTGQPNTTGEGGT